METSLLRIIADSNASTKDTITAHSIPSMGLAITQVSLQTSVCLVQAKAVNSNKVR